MKSQSYFLEITQSDGEREKALSQAKKLPNLYKGRENALVSILDGKEKRNVALEALTPLAWSISHHMNALAQTTGDESYLSKVKQILAILHKCNNDPFVENLMNNNM